MRTRNLLSLKPDVSMATTTTKTTKNNLGKHLKSLVLFPHRKENIFPGLKDLYGSALQLSQPEFFWPIRKGAGTEILC